MVDMAMIQSTLSSLKTAGDITKAILELNSLTKINERIIELQAVLIAANNSALSAKMEHSEMIDRERALKKEMADFKAWKRDKKRYELCQPRGVFGLVYGVKEVMRIAEAPHYLCTHCADNGKKSIMQPDGKRQESCLVCPNCNLNIHVDASVVNHFCFVDKDENNY